MDAFCFCLFFACSSCDCLCDHCLNERFALFGTLIVPYVSCFRFTFLVEYYVLFSVITVSHTCIHVYIYTSNGSRLYAALASETAAGYLCLA